MKGVAGSNRPSPTETPCVYRDRQTCYRSTPSYIAWAAVIAATSAMSKSGRGHGSSKPPGQAGQAQSTATVVYDEERPPVRPVTAFDDLDAPDIDAILRKKRKWYHRIGHFELPRRTQMVLTGLSIVLSAVQANGVYCWPT